MHHPSWHQGFCSRQWQEMIPLISSPPSSRQQLSHLQCSHQPAQTNVVFNLGQEKKALNVKSSWPCHHYLYPAEHSPSLPYKVDHCHCTAPCALSASGGVAGGWGQNQWNKWGKHSTCDTFQNTICRAQTVSTIELQNSTLTAFMAFKQYVDQVLWYCEVAEELLILCCPSNEVPPSSAPQNCCH